MTLTLYDPKGNQSGEDLARLAHTLEAELKRVPGTRDIYTVGNPGPGGCVCGSGQA